MDLVFDRAFRRVIGWRVRLDIGHQLLDAFVLFAIDVWSHEPPIIHEHRCKCRILVQSLLLRHRFLAHRYVSRDGYKRSIAPLKTGPSTGQPRNHTIKTVMDVCFGSKADKPSRAKIPLRPLWSNSGHHRGPMSAYGGKACTSGRQPSPSSWSSRAQRRCRGLSLSCRVTALHTLAVG